MTFALTSITRPRHSGCKEFCAAVFICLGLASSAKGFQNKTLAPHRYHQNMVNGAQFQDLILPRPIIDGLESKGIWGGDNVLPRDIHNGLEDNQWSYWGGNPVLDEDGNYHVAICRWPASNGHGGWHKSEVAHAFSKNPLGPYQVTQTIIAEGHNPEVLKLANGSFLLHTLNRNRIYTAQKMTGPWKNAGRMKLDARGFRDYCRPDRMKNWIGSNLTTTLRPDGSILMMMKDGGITYSATGVQGPYRMIATASYPRNTGYAEDPVIWRSRHQYHAIYNHAQDQRSVHIRSLDGVHWKYEGGLAYGADSFRFTDGTKNAWYKFERPKIIQDSQGRATHLSLAVLDVRKRDDKGDDKHSSKNVILPLVVEKQIWITDQLQISTGTQTVKLRIAAEPDFNPAVDLDFSTLRFGSERIVNVGRGATAIDWQPRETGLEITFKGDFGRSRFDYDFKLLGTTKNGDIVFGYALLPDFSPKDPTLIVAPVKLRIRDNDPILESWVENAGHSPSQSQQIVLLRYDSDGRHELSRLNVKPLEPYQRQRLVFRLDSVPASDHEYVFQQVTPKPFAGHWRAFDNTDESIHYTGDWSIRNDENYFMGTEHFGATFGDSFKINFNGTRASVFGTLTKREMAAADVFIDGEFVEKIVLAFGNIRSRIYQTPPLPARPHTLELRSAPFDGRGSQMAIDYYEVESPDYKIGQK